MIDVLIVGAGIGGLTAARALTRAGLTVRIIERAPRPAAEGAGILLSGNALACLAALDLTEGLIPQGRWLPSMAITDTEGRALGSMGPPGAAPAPLAVRRGILHDVLLDGVAEVPLTLDATVRSVSLGPEHVDVELNTAETLEARLVLGADGIGSQIRNLSGVDEAGARRYAGYTCWRVVVEDPGVERGVEMWGRGQRIGLIPLGRGELYAFLVADAPRGTPCAGPTAPATLRARFAAFGGPASAVLDAIDESTDILHHDIEYLPRACYGADRVGLLGDAAHAMTPNMGQGAAMAIEDAYVLAEAVRAEGASPSGLGRYASRRAPRVEEIARRSLRIGRIGQWRTPLACALRALLMRATPDSVAAAQVRGLVTGGPAGAPPVPRLPATNATA